MRWAIHSGGRVGRGDVDSGYACRAWGSSAGNPTRTTVGTPRDGADREGGKEGMPCVETDSMTMLERRWWDFCGDGHR
jgi:hypothetical protein